MNSTKPPPPEVKTPPLSPKAMTRHFHTPIKKIKPNPILRFSPYAWAKLLAFRDYGPTEIAGFGISTGHDSLLIDDFITVKQACTTVTVAMDDDAVADYFDQQVDSGLKPEQFMRLWLHTHPGSSAKPSTTDEATFERVFGQCDWAVMFILARGGETYARLRFGVGPCAQMVIPVEVDFEVPFPAADHQAWKLEYEQHVTQESECLLKHLLGEEEMQFGDMIGHRHRHRSSRWQEEQEPWDIHDLNDLDALAHLEAALEEEMQEETEVTLDSPRS